MTAAEKRKQPRHLHWEVAAIPWSAAASAWGTRVVGSLAMAAQPHRRLLDVVSVEAGVMSGAAVFHGTRVPVKNLLDYLAAGDSLDEFLDQFPTVKREQAVALIELAEALLLSAADEASPR